MAGTRKNPDYNAHPSYKGGDTTIHGGYVHEQCPSHPRANVWGFVTQHRLVAEDMLGRALVQHQTDPKLRECVHHKNEDRTDNRKENLEVMTVSAHHRHHANVLNQRREASLTETMVSQKLAVHGTLVATAAALGVHHQTLRNRFPALVKPFLRSSPVDLANTEAREQLLEVLRHFSPTQITFQTLAKWTHVCAKSLARLCREHSIPWALRAGEGRKGRRLVYRGLPTRYAIELGAPLPVSDCPPE